MTKGRLKREVIPSAFTSEYSLFSGKDTECQRHIFIFLDGTWNEERTLSGEATPTNVLRMFQELQQTTPSRPSICKNKHVEIIAHYYRGVGSRQDNSAANRLRFGFNGKDEERIRSAAFADVYRNYHGSNDHIYILGFSRGAASARLLARDLVRKGLPLKLEVHTTHFPNLLTGQIEARVEKVDRLGDFNAYYPNVAFLGCWDTVDAFVLPSRFPKQGALNIIMDKAVRILKSPLPRLFGSERFDREESEIPGNICKAVHCVAIDETRNAFLPTLMPDAPNVEEVWFPGVHSDIGGGYDDNLLAKEPYKFMKKRLIEATNLPENKLFKSSKKNNRSSEFCFHFQGLNAGLKKAKGLFGFGTSMRSIRVLHPNSDYALPKVHDSLYRIINSDSVFAANTKNKRTWSIIYSPYNIRELKGRFKVVKMDEPQDESYQHKGLCTNKSNIRNVISI